MRIGWRNDGGTIRKLAHTGEDAVRTPSSDARQSGESEAREHAVHALMCEVIAPAIVRALLDEQRLFEGGLSKEDNDDESGRSGDVPA